MKTWGRLWYLAEFFLDRKIFKEYLQKIEKKHL
jgi:hypothetical protein